MSASDDEFELVNYTSGSDSEWERIDYSGSEDEGEKKNEELIKIQQDDVVQEPIVQQQGELVVVENHEEYLKQEQQDNDDKGSRKRRKGYRRRRDKKVADMTEFKRVAPRKMKGILTPEDNVDTLNISEEDVVLLASHSVYTIGQLACFDVTKLAADDSNRKKLTDLQEEACQIATEYLTKMSSDTPLWGYCYISESKFIRGLKYGYFDSDSLYFVWSPMSKEHHRNCITIDRIMAKETKNPNLHDRYFRKVKIDLRQICEDYEGTLVIKSGDDWCPIRLTEAEAWMAGDDIWNNFEPGTDLYQHVPHGKIDIPHGQIPLECIEFEGPLPVRPRGNKDELKDHELARFIPKGYDEIANATTHLKHPLLKAEVSHSRKKDAPPYRYRTFW